MHADEVAGCDVRKSNEFARKRKLVDVAAGAVRLRATEVHALGLCLIDDVARIGALVGGRFTGETPANLTHLLREVDGVGVLLSYSSQSKRPADPALLNHVSTWIANDLNTTPPPPTGT